VVNECMVLKMGATGCTVRVRFLAAQKIFSSAERPRLALRLTKSRIQWAQGALSPGVKRSRREADHSPRCSMDVKNDGVIPLLPDRSSWRGA
jgi:hypothetical protein